jgi:hypothetical protein
MARNHVFTRKIWQAPVVRKVRHAVSIPRIYRHLSAGQRRLPDFIIAGAAKAGTTSLWWYLVEHPHVIPPMKKEVCYFDVNFHRGINWYRMHFPLDRTARSVVGPQHGALTGESSPYYMFHPLAPARIAATLPDVKIIMLLRNPVDRAFSHYQLKVKRRHETLSFDEAIEAETERLAGEHEKIVNNPRYYSAAHDRSSYLARGLYLEQIQRWQQYFPRKRLLVLESGEFFRQTADVYQRVLDYLGLPPWKPEQFGNRYPGKYSEKLLPDTLCRLIEYFAPHNEQLYAYLGTRFNWDTPQHQAASQTQNAA